MVTGEFLVLWPFVIWQEIDNLICSETILRLEPWQVVLTEVHMKHVMC